MIETTYEKAVELAKNGCFSEAENICGILLETAPDDYLTLYLLASIQLHTRRYEECRSLCQRLLQVRQDNPDAFNLMAAISADYDLDNDATEIWLRKALKCAPNHTKGLVNLANLRVRKQDDEEALALYRRVIALTDGKEADAINGLGMIAANRGEFEEAITYYKDALKLAPDDRQVLTNLISTIYALKNTDRRDEALDIVMRIADFQHPGLAAIPAFASAKSHCLWDVADKLLRPALDELINRLKNYHVFMLPNLALLSSSEVSNEELLAVHYRAGQSLRQIRLQPPFEDHPAAFTPSNKIRIGYISPDIKAHVVSQFFRGLVNHRDRGRFEVFLYSNLSEDSEDEVTGQYRANADHFIPVLKMRDLELAERIRADGIQVLVEMSGYTTGNRLGALSYRPAPVQISYMGYPYTYGIEEFDYHISDPWLDGSKNADFFIEKPLRLPQSFLSFGDFAEQEINPEPPVLRNGYVTFGSLNNSYKLNRKTVELWSQVMQRVEGSRLYLNHSNYKMLRTRKAILDEFAKHGITSERINFVTEKHPGGSHLRYYNEFDIALDSMPLTGGTTTVETLWMGLPLITLVGDAHAQRMSYSIVKNVGIDLDDCIAFTEAEYVERAVALALNPERIRMLRSAIPEALRVSILQDTVKFAGQFENLLVDAWNAKFPATPLEGLLDSAVYTPLPLANAHLVVYDSLRDKHAFVLREQGKWYEPESQFLQRHASVFRMFWDFATDPGVFAVPFAARQGKGGHTLTVRGTGLAALLIEKSIAHNQLENLSITSAPTADLPMPDMVRFSLDFNDGQGGSIVRELALVDSASPLILASLRDPQGLEDWSGRSMIEERGYQAYRLLPGYELLVPLGDDRPEPSDINLFFCKPDRAEQLARLGLLAVTQDEINPMPLPVDTFWLDRIQSMLYASAKTEQWLGNSVEGQWGDMYRLALNLDAAARDFGRPAGQRWGCVQMASSILMLLAQGEPTAARLLTGIRVMADMGKRATAVEWSSALVTGLEGLSGTMLDEPFLPPLEDWEHKPVADDEVAWARLCAMVAGEQLRSFSSWYTADESLAFWQGLAGHSLLADKPQHMTDLIRKRLAASAGVISLLNSSALA